MRKLSFFFSREFLMEQDFRRKLFHMFVGFSFVYVIHKDLVPLRELQISLAIILLVGLIASIVSRHTKVPVLKFLLDMFERKKHIDTFPGKGAFFFIAGVLFCITLFEKDVALASIMILSLGDTFAHFVGKYYGKTRLQISKTKVLEGTIGGTIAATFGALLFVNIYEAIFASMIAMIVEAVELEFMSLDDNFSVPLAAGIALTAFRLLSG